MGIIDTGTDPGEHNIISNASRAAILPSSRPFPLSGTGPCRPSREG